MNDKTLHTGVRYAVATASVLALGTLAACGSTAAANPQNQTTSTSTDTASSTSEKTNFKIGVGADNPTEAAVVTYLSEKLAPEHGISIELVQLEDSRHLNEAVNAGELDGHIAIHDPYLQSVLAEQPDWQLASSSPVYSSILTISSRKHTSLDDIPSGATVSIPDDPSNEAKSVEFLADQGLIALADVEQGTSTIEDVTDNPHNLQFVKVAGQQLARSLDDVDFSVVQSTYLRAAGVGREVELVRAPQPDYLAIVLVTRTENAQGEDFAKLRDTIEDHKLDDYIDQTFGDVIAGVR
ncbi:MAG: MetQ/NlpA family ABC transporter substrate-binding protein [Propionicimonas sp.]|uniref:MetQ/NlpA family ABC transporter substrate-binding protein n=1 Tax=Propionicimonas sp. TaxID=1955623 RepID=UPI002B218CF4|nr:MetQ/NlpA family ABC transporter substrate-binding protein [Propionicimonas sp.]MEA4944836.1 MetQ/NlpA family ABC transporter substrate-binding protein [Propionicimonas sp.]MEA5116196.1 MetQ/NlpA family ABC transporter substrate-binding protein [Propionicimonas sp.]